MIPETINEKVGQMKRTIDYIIEGAREFDYEPVAVIDEEDVIDATDPAEMRKHAIAVDQAVLRFRLSKPDHSIVDAKPPLISFHCVWLNHGIEAVPDYTACAEAHAIVAALETRLEGD